MFDSKLVRNGEQIVVRKVLQLCRMDGTVLFEYADGELNVPLSVEQVKTVPVCAETSQDSGVVLRSAVTFDELEAPLQAFLGYFDKRSWRKICTSLANSFSARALARALNVPYNTLAYRLYKASQNRSKSTIKSHGRLKALVPDALRTSSKSSTPSVPDTVYLLEENGQPIEVGNEAGN